MALDVGVRKHKNGLVVELVGRLVDLDVRKFSKKMESAHAEGTPFIAIDVSKLSFINSQGLGVIVYYHTTMQRESRQLLILNANPDPRAYVNRLFEMTNLYSVFRVVRSAGDI